MQKGWIWAGKQWEHTELLDYAREYPVDFPYTEEMLVGMFQEHERNYISPTLVGRCPREVVLRMQSDFYIPLEYAWVMYRGTIGHLIMESGSNEPDAILEQRLEYNLPLPNGTTVLIKGTPDKIIPSKHLLIDYKTVHTLERLPKAEWVKQLSLYKWLIKVSMDVDIHRAFIQQIGMKSPKRLEIPLWDIDDAQSYMVSEVMKLRGAFTGVYSLEKGILPPVLSPKDDGAWKCVIRQLKNDEGAAAWCPVQQLCQALYDMGINGTDIKDHEILDVGDMPEGLIGNVPVLDDEEVINAEV